MPLNESNRVASMINVNLVFQNSFFKDDEFSDNPIKTFQKPYYLSNHFNASQ